MVVRQCVEYCLPLPAAAHELTAFENFQLMRDRGLRHPQCLCQIADTDLRFQQDKEDADARGIPENLEKLRQIVEVVLGRQLLKHIFQQFSVYLDAVAAFNRSFIHILAPSIFHNILT